MPDTNNPSTFEDYLPTIDAEIAKRRHKWSLSSVTWMDFDDVSQIIRIHIYKKWHLYNPKKPIKPWLNVIISHQIKNLIRNIHTNHARPCLRCAAAVDNLGCKIYVTQCDDCPLFRNWKKRKAPALNIKIPVSIENHSNEMKTITDNDVDIVRNIDRVHDKMKEILKPLEYEVYSGLFILHQDEATVAKNMGYISNEHGRTPGYKQIKNIRKTIIQKVRKSIANNEIDIY